MGPKYPGYVLVVPYRQTMFGRQGNSNISWEYYTVYQGDNNG